MKCMFITKKYEINKIINQLGAPLHKIRLQESQNNAAEIYVDQKLTNSLKLKFENSLVTQT